MATRTISISLPEDLFKQAESLAKVESRTMSELFREALRSYRAERIRQRLREDHEYARSLSPLHIQQAMSSGL